MGKFESSGAEYGKGLERKRAAVALRPPRPKSTAPPARRPIASPPPPPTTKASTSTAADNTASAPGPTLGVNIATLASPPSPPPTAPRAASSPAPAVRSAATPQKTSPRMERPVLARKPSASTIAADFSHGSSSSNGNSVNRKNSRSQSPSIIRRSPHEAVRLSRSNSNGSIHNQQQLHSPSGSGSGGARMTPPRDSNQNNLNSISNSPQTGRPSVSSVVGQKEHEPSTMLCSVIFSRIFYGLAVAFFLKFNHLITCALTPLRFRDQALRPFSRSAMPRLRRCALYQTLLQKVSMQRPVLVATPIVVATAAAAT